MWFDIFHPWRLGHKIYSANLERLGRAIQNSTLPARQHFDALVTRDASREGVKFKPNTARQIVPNLRGVQDWRLNTFQYFFARSLLRCARSGITTGIFTKSLLLWQEHQVVRGITCWDRKASEGSGNGTEAASTYKPEATKARVALEPTLHQSPSLLWQIEMLKVCFQVIASPFGFGTVYQGMAILVVPSSGNGSWQDALIQSIEKFFWLLFVTYFELSKIDFFWTPCCNNLVHVCTNHIPQAFLFAQGLGAEACGTPMFGSWELLSRLNPLRHQNFVWVVLRSVHFSRLWQVYTTMRWREYVWKHSEKDIQDFTRHTLLASVAFAQFKLWNV